MQKKRITAPMPGRSGNKGSDPPTLISDNTTSIRPILKNVMDGCYTKELDPSCCIPLYLSRHRSRNAVRKLKAIFQGEFSESMESLSGLISGTPTSVVVPLTKELDYLISDYFINQNYGEKDVEAIKRSEEVWYGVIDGCKFHCAIMELREEQPHQWGSFLWNVIVVQPGKPLNQYRQLSRNQNERNRSLYHYECTVYDLLSGLCMEYDILYQEALKSSRTGVKGVKINHRLVAERYDGGYHHSKTCVKQAVTVASRLYQSTIEAIGEVCNLECADIILKSSNLNSSNWRSVEQIVSHQDCRLFRSFVSFGALWSAKAFMTASIEGKEDAQVNCIYRLKHWSESNDFRRVQGKVVGEQFGLAVLALKEEDKFLDAIQSDEWPEHMDTIKENVLRTTLCDDELMVNSGNDGDVLPSIWKCFERLHPGLAKAISVSLKENNGTNAKEQTSTSPHESETSDAAISGFTESTNDQRDKETEEAERLRKEQEQERKEQEEKLRKQKLRDKGNKFMLESNISMKNMTYSTFLTEVWSSTTSRVDLVLSAIPKEYDMASLDSLPSFCKRVLKTGCYVILIVSQAQYSKLEPLFEYEGFKVMDYAFQILYDKSTIQRRHTVDFPQRQGDIAILARTQGAHPTGYHPDFSDKESGSMSDDMVKFASIINVQTCQDKLKRPNELKAIRTEEKSVQLYSHLIKMLSPPRGTVLDPIAGPSTLSLACLQTNRTGICIEEDYDCFRFAVGRTRIFSTPNATMEQLEDFSEPDKGIDPPPDEGSPLKKRRKELQSVSSMQAKTPSKQTKGLECATKFILAAHLEGGSGTNEPAERCNQKLSKPSFSELDSVDAMLSMASK